MAGTFEDEISADKKSVGFTYQDYYTLLVLLSLKNGETVGVEVKDDIHIEHSDGTISLMQLKHTLQKKSNGSPVNLTELDGDFWKTIYNWINIIRDTNNGGGTQKGQIGFIEKCSFRLVSNKSEGVSAFLKARVEYIAGTLSVSQLKSVISGLYGKTTDKTIKAYILELKNCNDEFLDAFCRKLGMRFGQDDLIDRIKCAIREHHVRTQRVDHVFDALVSQFTSHRYKLIKDGERVNVTFDEFDKIAGGCFERGHLGSLPRKTIQYSEDPGLDNFTFAKQLIDLGIQRDDILDCDYQRILANNHLLTWYQEGDVTDNEVVALEKETELAWKPLHDERHIVSEGADSSVQLINSKLCLFDTRKIDLRVRSEYLGREISNGVFYRLADRPVLGWCLDWKAKYSK